MKSSQNPLLENHLDFPYQRLKPEHILPAVKELRNIIKSRLLQIEKNTHPPTWNNTMEILEQCTLLISKIWKPVEHILMVHHNSDFQRAYDQGEEILNEIEFCMEQSKVIFSRLHNLKESDEYHRLSLEQKRALENHMKIHKSYGVHLSPEKKQELFELSQQSNDLSNSFYENMMKAIEEYSLVITDLDHMTGLSQRARARFSENYKKKEQKPTTPQQGPWLIQLHQNDYDEVIIFSDHRWLREKIYQDYQSRASKDPYDNSQIIYDLIQIREKIAHILGYESYTAGVLDHNRMMSCEEEVLTFLQHLKDTCTPGYHKHLEALRAFKESQGDLHPLEVWDYAYWERRFKESLYNYHTDSLREYLPFDQVLKGLLNLIQNLFSVRITSRESVNPEHLWHEDVMYFEVTDADQKEPIAWLYLDPYARPGTKRESAWCHPYRTRHIINGKVYIPITYVMCHFNPPTKRSPSLLSWRDMETLFHEFGHALQNTLSTVNVASVSGINGIEWDAIELPSQFMEHWCYHKPTLQSFAQHYETGEVLPDILFEKILHSKHFGKAYFYMRQTAYSIVDIKIHCQNKSNLDPFTTFREILGCTQFLKLPLPHFQEKFLCSFLHIFVNNYEAGYYSYLWSQVMSSDAFSKFEEHNFEKKNLIKTGKAFRNTILSLGGSRPAQEVYQIFAGRKATLKAFLLQNSLDPSSIQDPYHSSKETLISNT